jgi:hypothetical protein
VLDPPLEVLRDQRDHQEQDDDPARDRRRDHSARQRRWPGQDADAQEHPEDHQRRRVHEVGQYEEGEHPAGGAPARHAGLAQRPVGEHEATGARGGEDPRGREAGHRDLVRGAQVEAAVHGVVARAAEHAAEERHVSREREHVEADRGQDPVPLRLVELVDGLVRADDPGEQHVDRDHEQEYDHQARDDLAPVLQERLEAADLELFFGDRPL